MYGTCVHKVKEPIKGNFRSSYLDVEREGINVKRLKEHASWNQWTDEKLTNDDVIGVMNN